MKHFKRLNLFKASNVTFNPETNEAISYDWWTFVKVINGKLVFNSYNYSPSTIKHQYKVRALLNELGINIDIEVACPAGLQSSDAEVSTTKHYSDLITKLKEQIAKPRSQAKKNQEREALIQEYAEICVKFKMLIESK